MFRVKNLCAGLTALLALGASQTTLAQTCADLIFADDILERMPEAGEACLDVVQRDGRSFAHFTAEVVQVRGREVRARFALPDGSRTDTYAFQPDPSTRVQIGSQSLPILTLNPGQEMNLYIPSDRWEVNIPDEPDFLVAQVVVVTPYRPAPDDTVAALPRTASPLPLIGLLGIAFTVFGSGLALIRRRLG